MIMVIILQRSKYCLYVKNSIDSSNRITVYSATKKNQNHEQILLDI
jgi:hypothetical protein